jgi:hypothetical protein
LLATLSVRLKGDPGLLDTAHSFFNRSNKYLAAANNSPAAGTWQQKLHFR